VEQAIQFSVAAAKATVTDKEKKDTLDKLLLQGDAAIGLLVLIHSKAQHWL
jgi:hypothetical protein